MKHLGDIESYDEEITKHLERRSNSDVVNLLWRGYLCALLEWQFIDAKKFDELQAYLSSAGDKEFARPVVSDPYTADGRRKLNPKQLMKVVANRVVDDANSDTINLLLKGYTAALQLSRFYEPGEYAEQRGALKPIGDEELNEIFVGWEVEDQLE